MAKFNKILVPLDGSSNSTRGLDRAIEIAKGSGAEITGFYVFHLPMAAGIKYTQKMKDEAQKKAVKAIGPAMKKTRKAGATFKYKTGSGHTGSEIVKFAQKGKFDMIVIGARGMGGIKRNISWKHIKLCHAQNKDSCISCKIGSFQTFFIFIFKS